MYEYEDSNNKRYPEFDMSLLSVRELELFAKILEQLVELDVFVSDNTNIGSYFCDSRVVYEEAKTTSL